MKNLMIIVPSLTTGGQEKVAVLTADFLRKYYNVYMVIFEHVEKEFHTDASVICLNSPASSNPFVQAWQMTKRNYMLHKLKKKLKIDISFSFGEPADVSNLLSKYKERTVLSIHGYSSIPSHPLVKTAYKFIFGKADKTVCVSEKITQDFAKTLGLPLGKCVTIYNPFDVEKIRQQAVQSLDIDLTEPAVAMVGRLHPIKNFEFAIQAVDILKNKYSSIKLYIAGEGAHRPVLEKLIKDLGVEDHVALMGNMENPFCLIGRRNMLLCTSYNEGFGNTLIEAMVCGTPVISVDCNAGPREILAPNTQLDTTAIDVELAEYGILVPVVNYNDTLETREEKVQKLAQAIEIFIADCIKAEEYKNKYDSYISQFDKNTYIKRIINVLEKD